MKYNEWLNGWLNNYIKPTTKIRTYERYKIIVDLHIIPKIGEYELCDISPIILQKTVTELMENGNIKTKKALSANTINTIISVIQNSLKVARLNGLTSEYVADKIRRPHLIEKQIECFTIQEQKLIEQAVLSSKKTKLFGIVLSFYTGVRIGELLSLKWEDIDFNKSIMIINKSCHDGKNGIIIDMPKTQNSYRIIPIPKQLLSLLKDQKKKSNAEYVVSNNNMQVSVRSYQRSFELILKKLRLKHRGFHSTRHTFATRALECGMDVKTLSEILGHKNSTITLNRYAHSLLEHKQEMMNKLGKIF